MRTAPLLFAALALWLSGCPGEPQKKPPADPGKPSAVDPASAPRPDAPAPADTPATAPAASAPGTPTGEVPPEKPAGAVPPGAPTGPSDPAAPSGGKPCAEAAKCAGGHRWSAEKCACVPDPGGAAAGGACKSDADCRLFDDYCTGCDCRALSPKEPDPVCKGPGVRCLVQPCRGKSAACDAGRCVVR